MSPTTDCNDLDPFFDGELSDDGASRFREHLPGCARCQDVLLGRMLEETMIAAAGPVATPAPRGPAREPSLARPTAWLIDAGSPEHAAIAGLPPAAGQASGPAARAADTARAARVDRDAEHARELRAPPPRGAWLAWAVPAVAGAMALVLWWRASSPPGPPPEPALAIALAPRRGVDVRFTTPELDGHRTRVVMRAGVSADGGPGYQAERIATETVLALERRSPGAALAACALNGDLGCARRHAGGLPATAAALSDRAALALLEVARGDAVVPPPAVQAAAEHALSLAVAAQRLDPRLVPARWNAAIALDRLQLPLSAAAMFDRVADAGEPGWSREARARASDLRAAYRTDVEQRAGIEAELDRMVGGGPIADVALARRAPGLARAALHRTLAGTADASRLRALQPLADALGERAVAGRVRRSDLGVRRALVAQLIQARAAGRAELLRAVRARARAARADDIADAIALDIDGAQLTAADLGELDRLSALGGWWRLVAAERLSYWLVYHQRRYAAAADAARPLLDPCGDAVWCVPILHTTAAAEASIGRVDRAYLLAARARQLAREAGDRAEEGRALSVTGQIIATRVAPQIDTGVVADAYLREAAARSSSCAAELYRLDFGTIEALDHHRPSDAAELLAKADQLDTTTCAREGARFNAEHARTRLIALRPDRARAAELDRRLTSVERADPALPAEQRTYIAFMRARAALALGERSAVDDLRAVIARARHNPDHEYSAIVRERSLAALAEHAVAGGDPALALALIGERLGIGGASPCVLAIGEDDRVTVIAAGRAGPPVGFTSDVPPGARTLRPDQIAGADLRARLAGCPVVEVLATGRYFGVPDLLAGFAWAYRASPRPITAPARIEHVVVVTDVRPPPDLGLPGLRAMKATAASRSIAGPDATPSRVLAELATADLAIINAHGITDANEPAAASLVLSPDDAGQYALTADMVGRARLASSPIVVLAACNAGKVQLSPRPWSLASAFLAAGARAVIAPSAPIDDDTANEVFGAIARRVRSGDSPAHAVAMEQRARGGAVSWLSSMVVFQ